MSPANLYAANDGRFPDGAAVLVRYSLPGTPAGTDREDWPWVAGFVLGQCGPNEWHVGVDGRPELAEPDPDDPDGDPLFPACFRDASELMRVFPDEISTYRASEHRGKDR